MNEKKLASIITAYKKLRENHVDTLLSDCSDAISLNSAIIMAATATGHTGKRHSHQCRIPGKTLVSFADILLKQSDAIASVVSFDALLNLLKNYAPAGIGPLAIYDTAHRIGGYLNIYPNRVYLHSGTRSGAENLLGKITAPYIVLAHLPAVLQGSGLSAAELEDLFCIYKDRLKTCI